MFSDADISVESDFRALQSHGSVKTKHNDGNIKRTVKYAVLFN
jgi:hypothetical protein